MSQHMTALEKANRCRLAHAAVKRRVKSGGLTVAEVLTDPDPDLYGLLVFDLLCAQHRWGRRRAVELMWRLRIGERRVIGELTERQRQTLADRLEPVSA